MMNYAEFLKDPAIFYAALGAFVGAVLVDLYIRTRKVKHEDAAPYSHRIEKALAYFQASKTRKRITNDVYQELTGVSHATASRDLDKLVDLGYLERHGKTNTTTYRLTRR